jgi:SAM-dependent methyltransferase
VLPSDARVHGVDRDPLWVEKARARAVACGLAGRFGYQVGVAEKLPFADASFDLVTCQTLLIHTPDPGAAIDEMIRVARPGGLILAAEPNNIARALIFDSLNFHDPVDEILARARLQLVCERGKAALGEGNNSIGDLIPSLFAERHLVDVRVYLNDKTNVLLPPYDSPEQRAMLDERVDLRDREFWIWSREDTHRYFLAGNGREGEFDALWSVAIGGGEGSTALSRIRHTRARERASAISSPAGSQNCPRNNLIQRLCFSPRWARIRVKSFHFADCSERRRSGSVIGGGTACHVEWTL